MKKILPVLIILLVALCPFPVLAAEGNIRVILPKEMKGMTLNYAKVGDWEDEEALQENVPYDGLVIVDEEGIAKIKNLEEGIYLIEISGNPEYTVMPTHVSVPLWSEEEQRMLYEVSVIPKYNRNIETVENEKSDVPDTGDESHKTIYTFFIGISFIIVVVISCHNRFKCGRMSHKYSR